MAKKVFKQSKPKTKQVQFELSAPTATKVCLAADFNGWDITNLPMKKGARGNWKVAADLPPGRYEYRFWVDGNWQDDPKAVHRVSNPFGSQNCVKTVE